MPEDEGVAVIPTTTKLHEASHLWAAAQLHVPIQKLVFHPDGTGKATVNDFEDLNDATSHEIIERFKNLYILSAAGLYCDIRTETTNVRSADDEKAIDTVVTGLIQRLPWQEIGKTDLFRTLERKSEGFVRDNWNAIENLAGHFNKLTYDQQEIKEILSEVERWKASR